MKTRTDIEASRRWVIKIGSTLLTNDGRGLDLEAMRAWVAQLVSLREQGIECIVVSSGAVAEGMQRLGWSQRPHEVHALQAAAAVGQMGLVQSWESCFKAHDIHTAQVLLTHDDLSNRKRYLNARTTLRELLRLGVIPVVNENDSVVTEEIRFGDNDTLAALVANLVEADLLVILTDQQGLFNADPRTNANAQLIDEARANDTSLLDMAGEGSALGRGGMVTKVRAARLAARSGASTIIASGREADCLKRIREGEKLGTLLLADSELLLARKQWLAGHLQMRGSLQLDAGAVKKLCESGSSLLAVGVTAVEGRFVRGDMVRCLDQQGREIARGLVNYNADEARKIMGQSSDRIEKLLGYVDEPELIHRDNLVLV
jgi:glutamate 5-kinase